MTGPTTTTELTIYQHAAPGLPVAITELGDDAARAFLDCFTAQIQNPNTRAAYLRNAVRLLTWTHERHVRLRDVAALHVAAYYRGARDNPPGPRA